jgi:hypothetical protein
MRRRRRRNAAPDLTPWIVGALLGGAVVGGAMYLMNKPAAGPPLAAGGAPAPVVDTNPGS